jgi:hypothetical protein
MFSVFDTAPTQQDEHERGRTVPLSEPPLESPAGVVPALWHLAALRPAMHPIHKCVGAPNGNVVDLHRPSSATARFCASERTAPLTYSTQTTMQVSTEVSKAIRGYRLQTAASGICRVPRLRTA